MKETLLLTGTIKPNNNGIQRSTVLSNDKYFDPEYRLWEYFSTIQYYINTQLFDKIIFCENSNYHFNNWALLEQLAYDKGVQLELLQFYGDEISIKKYWYAYWEAEIFDYAFKNSQLLQQSTSWYKVTWRYIVKNIDQIINYHQKWSITIFFYKGWGLAQFGVTTAFFKTTQAFYEEHLYKKAVKYIKDTNTRFLESVFYLLLKDCLLNQRTSWKTKIVPIYHFFSWKKAKIEVYKARLWLLGFWPIASILESIRVAIWYKI